MAYLDVDGTIVPTDGKRKAGIGMSYKGIWGYCPLLITLANTKELLYLVNRSGNAPSHQDAAGWIDKAIELVSSYAPRVCLRGDTDFFLTAHFDRWAQRAWDTAGAGPADQPHQPESHPILRSDLAAVCPR